MRLILFINNTSVFYKGGRKKYFKHFENKFYIYPNTLISPGLKIPQTYPKTHNKFQTSSSQKTIRIKIKK